MSEHKKIVSKEILAHYDEGLEADRLSRPSGQIELIRTQELMRRFLPPPPAVVYDVGGGAGVHAFWLAEHGYGVHLVDAVPLHIEQALQRNKDAKIGLASMAVGDARQLAQENHSADAVLLFGPLYHLTSREDRIKSLKEAHRVIKPGGVVMAVGISRFISTLNGLRAGAIGKHAFVSIMERDLEVGQHRNPSGDPEYFTTAYFHHPFELRGEVEDAGFHHEKTLAVEGPGRLLKDLETHWENPSQRAWLLKIIRRVETEPTLLGLSVHLMAVGRKNRS